MQRRSIPLEEAMIAIAKAKAKIAEQQRTIRNLRERSAFLERERDRLDWLVMDYLDDPDSARPEWMQQLVLVLQCLDIETKGGLRAALMNGIPEDKACIVQELIAYGTDENKETECH